MLIVRILGYIREPLQLLAAYNRMIRVYPREYSIAVLGIVTQIVFFVFYPLLFKQIIDHVIPEKSYSMLMTSVLEVAILIVVCSIGAHFQLKYMSALGAKAMSALRSRMVEKFGKLHPAFFSDMKGVDVLSRFTSDMDRVEKSMVLSMPAMIENIVVTVACLFTILFIDWRMALAALILLPVGFIGNMIFGKREDILNSSTRHSKNNMLETVEDFMKSWVIIRAFNDKEKILGRFLDLDGLYAKNSTNYSYTLNAMPVFSEYGVNIGVAVIIVVSAILSIEGTLSVGAFIGCFALLKKVADGSSKSAKEFTTFFNAKRPLKRMLALLDEREVEEPHCDAMPVEGVREEILFRGINFEYFPGKPILRDVNFSILAGQSVAIVGPSGSGKSTVLKLLMRLHKPCGGSITFDGKQVEMISQSSFYDHICTILQEHHLIRGTIEENIAFGNKEISLEEMTDAAKAAQIHNFISELPLGYKTLLDDRGSSLSGGQRQRIAIARSLIRKCDILIMDEPTSMLDPENEVAVNASLRSHAAGKTIIMVTHRLEATKDYDKILVMENGSVVEEGTHAELLLKEGSYAALWRKQHGFTFDAEGYARIIPERLRAIPIFAKVNPEVLDDLAQHFLTESFEAGSILINEGSKGDKFYITVRGTLQVLKKGPDGIDKELVVLSDGDHFGEIALLKSIPRTASIKALSHTSCLTLSRERFLKLVESQPDLRVALEEAMEARRTEAPIALKDPKEHQLLEIDRGGNVETSVDDAAVAADSNGKYHLSPQAA